MYSAIAAFVFALTVAAILTPIVRDLALRWGAVDVPDPRRVHRHPIPRLGGLAVVIANFAGAGVLFLLETDVARIFLAQPSKIVGLAAGGVLVCVLGAADDLRGIGVKWKLATQSLAAVVAYGCGYRIEVVDVPFVGLLDMGAFALPITMIWIVGVINALNLIDGLDGLAAGVAFFACITNFTVALLTNNGLVMLLSATLAGSIIGFLMYNFNPATIFMGDSGSMFLGYVLATSSLMGASIKSSTTVAILTPIIAMGLPIVDMLFAVVRRVLESRPIFSPDRGHIHHRLLDLGITHRRAVLMLYAFSIVCCVTAIIIAIGRSWQLGGALMMMSIAVIGLFRAVGYSRNLQSIRNEAAPSVSALTPQLRRSVPALLRRLDQANGTDSLSRALREFSRSVGMQRCTMVSGRMEDVVWQTPDPPDETTASIIHARFSLDRTGDAALCFSWHGTQSEKLLPQDAILLQLVADACEDRVASDADVVTAVAPIVPLGKRRNPTCAGTDDEERETAKSTPG